MKAEFRQPFSKDRKPLIDLLPLLIDSINEVKDL